MSKFLSTIDIRDLVSLCIVVAIFFVGNKASCQSLMNNQILMKDIQNAATIVKKFYQTEKNLPSGTADSDKLLQMLYMRTARYNASLPMPMPKSEGNHRVLDRFRVSIESSINQKSNTEIVWRKTPPSSWSGLAGSIGIVSNGDDRFLVYAVGEDGTPIRSEAGNTIYNVYNVKDDKNDDERLF